MANTFFLDVLRGAQEAATDQGATVLAVDSDYSVEREREHVELLSAQRIQGLAIAPVGPGEAMKRWLEVAPVRPTVAANAIPPPYAGATRVAPDSVQAMNLVVITLQSSAIGASVF